MTTIDSTSGKSGNLDDPLTRGILNDPKVAADLLSHYLPPEIAPLVDWHRLKPEPTHYFGRQGEEHIVDLLFNAPLKTGGEMEVLLLIEHKSRPDRWTPLQLGKYVMLALDHHAKAIRKSKKKNGFLPAVLPVVLYHGARPLRKLPRLDDLLPPVPELTVYAPTVPFVLIDLAAWDYAEIVGGPIVRALIETLKRVSDGTARRELAKIFGHLEGLASKAADPKQIFDLIGLLLGYIEAALARHGEVLTNAEVKDGVIRNIFKTGDEQMVQTWSGKIRAEGFALGEARGEAKAIVNVLRARFQRVPKSVSERILKIDDPVVLESLTVHAATCATLAAFTEALD